MIYDSFSHISELFRGNYPWDCIISLKAASIVFSVRIILSHARVLVGKTYLKRSLTPSILLKSGFQAIFSSSFVTTLLRDGEFCLRVGQCWPSVSQVLNFHGLILWPLALSALAASKGTQL